jgi:hypothetical protein
MKNLVSISFIFLIIILVYNTTIENYNKFIYGAFSILLIYRLYQKSKIEIEIYTKRKQLCMGRIVTYEKIGKESDEYYNVNIKFFSSIHNEHYSLDCRVSHLPKEMNIEILLDINKPNKSTIYDRNNRYQILFMMLGFLFFFYQFLHPN